MSIAVSARRLRFAPWILTLVAAFAGCSSSGGGPGEESVLSILIGEAIPGMPEDAIEKALAAAEQGLGYDFVNDGFVPIPVAPTELLIRPGTQILPESVFPGWCTAAFVFDGRSRIATAGHCTEEGDAVLALAAPSTVFVMGYTSESTGLDSKLGRDWALIDILPEWRLFTDPAVAFVGGPCGRASDPPSLALAFVGHGAVVGTGGTPRSGVYAGDEGGAFAAIGPSNFGDSGAPVVEAVSAEGVPSLCAGGGAVGILTHGEAVDLGGVAVVPTGVFYGTKISRIGNALDDGAPFPAL